MSRLTPGAKAALGAAVGGALIGAAIVARHTTAVPGKLVEPRAPYTPSLRAAEVPSYEPGTLWQLVDSAVPRRPPAPVQRPANYVQGPGLVRHADSSWSLLANAGACCDVPEPWGRGYEGIARLHFGAGWEWVLAPNEWTNPALDEHENAFPASWGGRIAYVATHWSQHGQPVEARVGLGLLTGGWGGAWTRNSHLRDADGTASLWSLGLVPSSGPNPWLYIAEVNASGRTIVRRELKPDGTLAARRVVTTWTGTTSWHPDISDVILGSDGAYYALEQVPEPGTDIWGWREIREWRSEAMSQPLPVEAGIVWMPTGRVIRPGLRTWWDVGYARTEDGHPAHQMLVGLCGDGRGAETGAWELCAWLPAGAGLPMALAGSFVQVVGPIETPTPSATATPGETPTPGPSPTVGPPSPTPSSAPDPVLVYRLPDGHLLVLSCQGAECLMAGGDRTWQLAGPWRVRVERP